MITAPNTMPCIIIKYVLIAFQTNPVYYKAGALAMQSVCSSLGKATLWMSEILNVSLN